MGPPREDHLYKPLKIGRNRIPGNLLLAPIAGYSDAAFREICSKLGADATVSEMVSAEGLILGNWKTIELYLSNPRKLRMGIQIFTSSPETAAKAVNILAERAPVFIDLNCGCPVPKVTKNGAGSALLKDPEKIYAIMSSMKEASDIPVTIKLRSGWDSESVNYRETADAAVSAGASMVALHSRTKSQGYSGNANREHITELKRYFKDRQINIPLLASGDLFSQTDALETLLHTGCDGLMFARGAIGRPWIFQSTKKLLDKVEMADAKRSDKVGTKNKLEKQHLTAWAEPSIDEKVAIALEHTELCARYMGEAKACREMRKHMAAYTKGLPGAASLRRKLMKSESVQRYRELMLSLTEGASG